MQKFLSIIEIEESKITTVPTKFLPIVESLWQNQKMLIS